VREWFPILAGWGLIIAVVAYSGLRPDSWLARHLRTSVHVVPTGPGDSYRRRDFIRFAGLACIVGFTCWVLSLGAGVIGERFVNLSAGNRIAMGYSFVFFLLGALAFAVGVVAAWTGVRYRADPDGNGHSGGTTA
jgi:hypothetical protein